MFGLLLRFRETPVAVSADFEGMFMQIGIKDEDQNALRFLWPTKNGIKQYQYTRLIFGAKCSPSIAIFALHQTAADYCVTKPIIAQLLHKSFYMDDIVHSFNTTHEARDSTTQLKSSLRQGGFNLTKFVSNTNDAICSIDGGEVSTYATVHRVLGVKWDTTDDTISVQPTTKLTNTTSSTLRTVLSTVARVFDPLGILAPFVIKLKILLQNLWKSGISWDETVPSEFLPINDKWVDHCKQVPPDRLPRLLGPQLSPSDIQLHVFCDASQDAMATCIYFRTACSSGIHATFLIGTEQR